MFLSDSNILKIKFIYYKYLRNNFLYVRKILKDT